MGAAAAVVAAEREERERVDEEGAAVAAAEEEEGEERRARLLRVVGPEGGGGGGEEEDDDGAVEVASARLRLRVSIQRKETPIESLLIREILIASQLIHKPDPIKLSPRNPNLITRSEIERNEFEINTRRDYEIEIERGWMERRILI